MIKKLISVLLLLFLCSCTTTTYTAKHISHGVPPKPELYELNEEDYVADMNILMKIKANMDMLFRYCKQLEDVLKAYERVSNSTEGD